MLGLRHVTHGNQHYTEKRRVWTNMGETVHIGEMAERLSDELFAEFLWEKVGPTNQNWPCELKEKHSVETHPADVVFYYDEPYQAKRTYIHCDLKSYAKGSIKGSAIKKALESLAKQITCAERSEEWQNTYTHSTANHQIVGLLFVYNHDAAYDEDFSKLVQSIQDRKTDIPAGSRLYILGPDDIYWINNVRYEIRAMRGSDRLPSRDRCRFFYPHTFRQANIRPEIARAATLEMLSSPWIILENDDPKNAGNKGITIFYKRTAVGTNEFVYLIDYLRHFQLLDENISVQIKVMPSNTKASGLFQKSCTEYIEQTLTISEDEQLAKIIKSIKFSMMEQVLPTFSTVELGMDYDRI